MLVAFENTAAAESAIRDTDFASETSELTRSQILVNSATSILQLANAAPQNVLALLG
jgi:flagellin